MLDSLGRGARRLRSAPSLLWLAPSLSLLTPVAAHAQGSLDPITLTCHNSGPSGDCTGVDECAPGQLCATLADGDSACLADDELVCCDTAEDCPTRVGAPYPVCGRVAGLPGDTMLCRQGGVDYCNDADELTHAQLLACHTARDGSLVLYAEGDCDGDGTPNAVEEAQGTEVCIAPPPRAIAVGDACVPLPTGCLPDRECLVTTGVPGHCEVTAGDEGTECVPSMRLFTLFCGGTYGCAADEVELSFEGRAFCIPDVCDAADLDLRDCIRDDTGRVAFAYGDCDQDGILNRDEANTAAVCAPDARPDAGAARDAGVVPPDAAAPADAGMARIDGGAPEVQPDFRGTGGCVCRTSGAGRRTPPLAVVGLAMVLALVRRRRRR